MTSGDPTDPLGPPEPEPALRPIEPRDHATVLQLNHEHPDAVSALTEQRLLWLLDLCDRADVIDVGGEVAGFVLTFAPGTAYDSVNYRAFAERYGAAFYYLDRIVVAEAFRRRGLAGLAYDEIERIAAPYGRLTLEVYTEPHNAASVGFHAARGFREVGILHQGARSAALLCKELKQDLEPKPGGPR
ncbi:MAG: GNAT family N-acetyltransferase [Nocardioides sp.]